MPDLEDFRGRGRWTKNDLDEFLQEDFVEGEALDYKAGAWVAPPGTTSLTSEAKKNLRRWIVSFANSKGGLLFVGVPEDPAKKGRPGTPDGVPAGVWGLGGASSRITDILSNHIHPALLVHPRVHSIPLQGTSEVIVVDIPQTSFPCHRLLEGQRPVPIRMGDQTVDAPSYFVDALEGRRGLVRPFLRLIHVYGKARGNGNELFERFKVANYGTASITNLQIGVVMSRARVRQPLLKIIPRAGVAATGFKETSAGGPLPEPLRALFAAQSSTTRVAVSQEPILPLQEVDFEAGFEQVLRDGGPGEDPIVGRYVPWGIWVVAEGIAPEFVAFHGGRSNVGPSFETLEGPPYDLDRPDPHVIHV